ncbi:hypothetical protein WR25_18073 [Diploscapter pachys]|uniref:ADF-H domain-containing protein n=1 Tax=Diploscapter pachys TaxID=2018661 RepID=A0A2A2LKC7_9BILA|nr:hypothetical protein WR25_18073 [Diploscapter pachys]
MTICSIPDDLKKTLKEFRFAKSSQMMAIIVKIDKEAQQLKVEETFDDCSIDEVRDELPQQQPRFILLSFAKMHSDGRVSYPMLLIFYSPIGCSPDLQMLYAGSRNNLVQECELTKNFEIRELEELTQEYIDSKL